MGDDTSNVVPFRKRGHDVERQILDGEIVKDPIPPVQSLRVANPHRVHRPSWLGVRRHHRRALRLRLAEIARHLGHAALYWPTRGLFEGIKRLFHWWKIGWKCWIGIGRFLFATSEHTGSSIVADDKGAKNRGRQVVMTGWEATKLAIFRCVLVGGPHFVLWAYLQLNVGWPYQWLTALPVMLYQILWGSQNDTKPMPPVAGPRIRQDVTIETMTANLRTIGILAAPSPGSPNPGIVSLVDLPDVVGTGKFYRWDLPGDCSKSAEDVVRLAAKLAGTYALPRSQFVVGLGDHEYQFTTWISRKDPFAGPLAEHPCVTMSSFDAWQPAPFGQDPMGRIVYTAYPYTSRLIAARPRVGKSFMAMSMLVPALLDPTVEFVLINLKGGGTWRGLKPIAKTYISGQSNEYIEAACMELERLVAEFNRRNALLSSSTKLTKVIAERLSMPLLEIIVDEGQEATGHPIYGTRIIKALETLGKVAPSCGMSLTFITQRPDKDTLPASLRAAFGEASCLQVKSLPDSNIALGMSMSKMGFDASKIRRRAVSIHVPDSNNDAIPDDEITAGMFACHVRTFDMGDDGEIFNQFCELGAALRGVEVPDDVDENGLEPGPDEEHLTAAALLQRLRERAPAKIPAKVTDAVMFGRWMSGLQIVSTKVSGGERLRPRSAVETALHLPIGFLTPLDEPPAGQMPGGTQADVGQFVGSVTGGSFQDPDPEE